MRFGFLSIFSTQLICLMFLLGLTPTQPYFYLLPLLAVGNRSKPCELFSVEPIIAQGLLKKKSLEFSHFTAGLASTIQKKRD